MLAFDSASVTDLLKEFSETSVTRIVIGYVLMVMILLFSLWAKKKLQPPLLEWNQHHSSSSSTILMYKVLNEVAKHQTNSTAWFNILQHCWIKLVEQVYPPCLCTLLHASVKRIQHCKWFEPRSHITSRWRKISRVSVALRLGVFGDKQSFSGKSS